MKNAMWKTGLAAALMMLGIPALVTGQEEEKRPRGDSDLKRPGSVERFLGAGADALKEKLGLTEQQKSQLDALIKEFQPKLEELRAKREGMEQDMKEIRTSAMGKFQAILTEEQKAKMKDVVQNKRRDIGDRMRGALFNLKALGEKLDLSEEQIKEVKEILSGVQDEMKKIREQSEGDPEKVREAMKSFQDKLVGEIKSVLDDKQKGALDEFVKEQRERREREGDRPRRERPRKERGEKE